MFTPAGTDMSEMLHCGWVDVEAIDSEEIDAIVFGNDAEVVFWYNFSDQIYYLFHKSNQDTFSYSRYTNNKLFLFNQNSLNFNRIFKLQEKQIIFLAIFSCAN